MDISAIIIGLLAGIAGGFGLGYVLSNKTGKRVIQQAEQHAKTLVSDAERDIEITKKERLQEVKDEWHKKKQEHDSRLQSERSKLQNEEKKLKERDETVKKTLDKISSKEKQLQQFEVDLKKKQDDLTVKMKSVEQVVTEQNARLERITGMSREDAKKFLMENMVNEAKNEASQTMKDIRDEAKLTAKKEAQKIIVQAIQRTASDHSVETTVSVVNLASEDMKGRIIGREGRNIRAFEAATGVDLIIDDTPEAVLISGFDPFRREVARVSLERLMNDGRIHPTRIEEIVEKATKELEEEMREIGEGAILELGLHNVHNEIIKYVGRMKYRSSYGQNLLHHSIEVAYLAGIMAMELGIDPVQAKRAGLLHDIGKCAPKELEGPHALVGMEIAQKYKELPIICNAIGAHHDDIPMESIIAPIVQSADSISGARPGARRESLESYIKRLTTLEGLAQGFEGVHKSFAIQAGREVRVIVEPDRIDDLLADTLAHDIAGKIEEELEYPGQIRVTVVRERRSVAYAR